VVETAVRESRKETPAYKMAALACLGDVLEAYKVDRFTDVCTIVTPYISKVRLCFFLTGHASAV
jgi:hypothetical protein